MDESNLRTSVVIEVSSKEKPEDQSMFQIDFEGAEPPKEYEIDQVFCGDNVTVYALFEIADVGDIKSNKKLIELRDSQTGNLTIRQKKSSKRESKHKKELETRTDEKLLCLPAARKKEINEDLNVLFKKDIIPVRTKSNKFKSLSKGVNTDIVQCPKLLDEIHKILNMNPLVKPDELSSAKPTYELFEMDPHRNLFCLGSESDKKPSPKFLLVPVLMTEDGMVHYFEKEDKSAESMKTSLGINTDNVELTKQVKENISDKLLERQESMEEPTIETKSSKNTILEEIKNMQTKLTLLIKSLETSELGTKSSNFIQESSASESTTATKEEEIKGIDSFLMESESYNTTQKTCQEPVYTSGFYSASAEHKKKKDNEEEKKEETASDTLTEWTDSSISLKNCNMVISDELKGLGIDWDEQVHKNKSGWSKSESKGISLVPRTCIKRSLSLNVLEAAGTKKFKNFKLDLIKTKGGRVVQNVENKPMDGKVVNIGDEALVKPKSKPDLEVAKELKKSTEKQPNKEGDAKSAYQQATELLANPENVLVHFCSNITDTNELFIRSAFKKELKNLDKHTNLEVERKDVGASSDKPKNEEVNANLEKPKAREENTNEIATCKQDKSSSPINFEISYNSTSHHEKSSKSSELYDKKRDKSLSPIVLEISDKSSSPISIEISNKSSSNSEKQEKSQRAVKPDERDKSSSPISIEISNKSSSSAEKQEKSPRAVKPEKQDKSSIPINWEVKNKSSSPIAFEISHKSSNHLKFERKDKSLSPETFEARDKSASPVESEKPDKQETGMQMSDLEKSTTNETPKRSSSSCKKEFKSIRKSTEKHKLEKTKTKFTTAERKSAIKEVTEIKFPIKKVTKKAENTKPKVDATKSTRPNSQKKKRTLLNKESSKVLVKVELHKTPQVEETTTKDITPDSSNSSGNVRKKSSCPSSVVVELFPKPKSAERISSKANNQVDGKKTQNEEPQDGRDVEADNQIIKSVWALTKVLLFEDGTQKFEVLEASLTPPSYSLNEKDR